MASPIGSEDRDVGELFENPHAFRFFQAVRLLEQAYPDRTPVGGFGEPNRETVRFGANPSLSFPASEIQSLQRNAEGRIEMAVNFIGLVGPLGVLPQHYTELITERLRSHDPTLLSFLNIFQHRITSLFHTAWKKHKFTIGYEADRNDPLTKVLFHLVGDLPVLQRVFWHDSAVGNRVGIGSGGLLRLPGTGGAVRGDMAEPGGRRPMLVRVGVFGFDAFGDGCGGG